MAEQDWLRPITPVDPAGTAWNKKQRARFELRPLSLGEVLDRIFALYRSRFWLFAGISMIAASVYTVGIGISLLATRRLASVIAAPPDPSLGAALGNLRAIGTAQAGTYAVLLIFVLVSAVTQAATALAMTQVYLQRPTSAKEALQSVLPRWYRWIAIAIWQGWSAAWVPLAAAVPAAILLVFATRSNATGLAIIGGILFFLAFFGGVPAGVVLYLRNALAVPASVSEGLTIRAAMRRSKVLAAGTKGRIFVVLLIAFCLLEVVGVLQMPLSLLFMMAPHQQHYLAMGISLLLTFVGHTVVAPVALIGLTLVYFDQRVRKEALDLQLLLEDARRSGTPGAGELPGVFRAGTALEEHAPGS